MRADREAIAKSVRSLRHYPRFCRDDTVIDTANAKSFQTKDAHLDKLVEIHPLRFN